MALGGLGVAVRVIAVVEVSAKIASLCLEYSLAVKDAKTHITRLETEVKSLQKVVVFHGIISEV